MGDTNDILSYLGEYSDIELKIDADVQALWCYMKPRRSPNFTLYLLRDLYKLFTSIEAFYTNHPKQFHLRYFILGSMMPRDVFNYGGDLALFARMIREKDEAGLRHYAHLCINALYRIVVHFNSPITTMAFVKGDALAGGLEVALAHDFIIAEDKAQFGVPESHFGLFPGMGAYSFLARRVGMHEAEKMILAGDLHSANHMHKLGLVDLVVPSGHGESTLNNYLRKHSDRYYSQWGLLRVRSRYSPVPHKELLDITDIWVDAALRLPDKDIRRMERLATTQTRRNHNNWTSGNAK